MKVQDLAARHVGQKVRIESERIRVQGLFEGMIVTSRTISDDMIYPPPPPETHLEGITVVVAGFRLDLTGQEAVTLLDGDQ